MNKTTIENTTLYCGNCIDILKTLPNKSINCCVTSPPYWGLRDYGTAKWEGGDSACSHKAPAGKSGGERADRTFTLGEIYNTHCGKCGAVRIDDQLGLEATPEEYVANMVKVFQEVKRVLRDDGTVWLNLGDSYCGGGRAGKNPEYKKKHKNFGSVQDMSTYTNPSKIPAGLKPKDLVGIPWRTAFALQADGWYLRSDIIWHKPNPMPESITDRPTKAHEYIFLLSKNKKYYYDHEIIKEDAIWQNDKRKDKGRIHYKDGKRTGVQGSGQENFVSIKKKRNKRTVWTITTKPFKGAHFAVFPPDLIEPCILAGCPEGGVVLDPFGGSGTVGIVAKKHNRKAILCDLNPEYIEMSTNRLK